MEEKKQPQPIIPQFKEYLETYIQLAKLKAIDKGTSVIASIVADTVIILGLSMVFLFASITLALYIGYLLNSYWEGFGCVALFYALVSILVMVFKKSMERPIINALIKKIL